MGSAAVEEEGGHAETLQQGCGMPNTGNNKENYILQQQLKISLRVFRTLASFYACVCVCVCKLICVYTYKYVCTFVACTCEFLLFMLSA